VSGASSRTGNYLSVRVVPRAGRSEIVGMRGDALVVRVAAPPVDGAANDELVRVLSAALRVPRSAVRVVSGAAGRSKLVEVAGMTAGDALAALS
jgi:uncharacterized protein (TIGR00251 family)